MMVRNDALSICPKCGAAYPETAWKHLRFVCGGSSGTTSPDGVDHYLGMHETRLCVCGETLNRTLASEPTGA